MGSCFVPSFLGLLLCIWSTHALACPQGCSCTMSGWVRCNGLTELSSNKFQNISVSWLVLKNSNVDTIQPFAFSNVEASYLQLEGLTANTIATNAFSNVTTSYLDINNGAIASIDSNAYNNVTVSHMTINDMNITTINAEVFNHLEVSHLKLHNINVGTVKSHAFGEKLKVSHLKIYESHITNLEDFAFNFSRSSVQFSTLYQTVITNRGCHALDGLRKTYSLTLSPDCGTHTIQPPTKCPKMCLCPGTSIICTGLNDLKDLESQNAELVTIRHSSVTIPSSAFEKLPRLKIVNVYNTTVTKVQANAFQHGSVSHLDIYNSNIDTIQPNAFNNMNVAQMSLYNLNIETFKSLAFGKNFTASILNIYNSTITTMQDNVFSYDRQAVRDSAFHNSAIKHIGCNALIGVKRPFRLTFPESCDYAPVITAIRGMTAFNLFNRSFVRPTVQYSEMFP